MEVKMPGQDGTGPMGQGPMTGRGLGFCNGYRRPVFRGRRFGRSFGRGMGFRRFQMPVQEVEFSKEDQKKILNEELSELEQDIKEIKKELEKLNK